MNESQTKKLELLEAPAEQEPFEPVFSHAEVEQLIQMVGTTVITAIGMPIVNAYNIMCLRKKQAWDEEQKQNGAGGL